MIKRIAIRNFLRLEEVSIDLQAQETVFVGPNNSGKIFATAIFRSFLASRNSHSLLFARFTCAAQGVAGIVTLGDAICSARGVF